MLFKTLLAKNECVFFDGPMETRIEYGTDLKLDKEMSIFLLVETHKGQDALKALYRTDIDMAMSFKVPIILNAPTFRASKEHCKRLHLPSDKKAIFDINKNCIDLVKSVRNEYSYYSDNIVITAPVGPKYAGFTPDNIKDLDTEINYHKDQINSVAEIGVDLISIAAMPGSLEAIGSAIVASKTVTDYTVGFVLTKEGTLLDKTPLDTVIREIDKITKHQPLGYIISCTHPSIAEKALSENKPEYHRIIGIKANGSAKPPKELLTLKKPEADNPKQFAKALRRLGVPRKFKMYGGCCGTDHSHLKVMIKLLRSKSRKY